ncbi:hypothetical protein OE88DRAFT_1355394 [Heliocybe sulcata]|uniref:Uncharacterized protein n=1 Tax=Heliocybe sulcata TaxID=5364 RepID=A0A5C3N5Y7_9AGAM|nr:hypothetical protein OE88DRAFT_1355394 [Heliocybe sulcata]
MSLGRLRLASRVEIPPVGKATTGTLSSPTLIHRRTARTLVLAVCARVHWVLRQSRGPARLFPAATAAICVLGGLCSSDECLVSASLHISLRTHGRVLCVVHK